MESLGHFGDGGGHREVGLLSDVVRFVDLLSGTSECDIRLTISLWWFCTTSAGSRLENDTLMIVHT